jgi:hypothetical protein
LLIRRIIDVIIHVPITGVNVLIVPVIVLVVAKIIAVVV